MENKQEGLQISTLDDAITVTKENKTKVSYYIFNEYEIHLNVLPSRSEQEWHYHTNIEEVMVVTSGELVCKWKEKDASYEKRIQVGELVQVKNSVHTFANTSDEDVTFIVFRLVLDGTDKREVIKHDKIIVET